MTVATVVDRLRELLTRAADEPQTVAVLTDEELLAVDNPEAAATLPTPWVTQQGDVDVEVARRFGIRSLLLRGLLYNGDGQALDVSPEVRIAVDTRRIGLGYVRATGTYAGDVYTRVAVVQPELGVFEEDVSPQGFHVFTACSYGDAIQRMAQWCLPSATGPDAGGTVEIAETQWPEFLLEELANASVTDLQIDVLLPDGDGSRAPERWLIAYDPATALMARPIDRGRLAVRRVTTRSLHTLLDERIARALDRRGSL